MPQVTHPEDFELESGLADDFNGTTTSARFGINSRYAEVSGSTDPMVFLTLESPDLSQPIEQGWGTGKAKEWEVQSGERELISRKQSDAHRYNMSSRAGQLVAAMITAVGEGDRVKGQKFFAERGHYMTQAEFYEGLTFHWKRQKLSTVGGETSDVLLPDKFLGTAVGAPKAETVDVSELVMAFASGKTEKELKQGLVKDPVLSKNNELMSQVFNKGLLAALEKSGQLVKGPDQKFI